MIRGIDFEGYNPADMPEKYRSQAKFLDRRRVELDGVNHADPKGAVSALLRALQLCISEGNQRGSPHAGRRHPGAVARGRARLSLAELPARHPRRHRSA